MLRIERDETRAERELAPVAHSIYIVVCARMSVLEWTRNQAHITAKVYLVVFIEGSTRRRVGQLEVRIDRDDGAGQQSKRKETHPGF